MIKYDLNKKHALICTDESQTEKEHKDSCDINIMLKKAFKGQQIRMSSSQPIYGHDDTTISGLDHRINKQRTEEELSQTFNDVEFSEKEKELFHPEIQKKFKIKVKKNQANNDESNDDKKPKTNDPDPKISNPS